MQRFPLVLALTACAPGTESLPLDAMGPVVPGFTVIAPDYFTQWEDIPVRVELPVPPAPPDGIQVYLARTDGGPAAAPCVPQVYGGECLDITGALRLYTMPLTEGGATSVDIDLPSSHTSDEVHLQAVVLFGNAAYFSAPTVVQRAAPCPDDANEDDDSRSFATSVTPPYDAALTSCFLDDDYVSFTVDAGARIVASAVVDETDGALELYIEGPNSLGNPVTLARSRMDANGPRVRHVAQRAGRYYVRADHDGEGQDPVAGLDYDLAIRTFEPGQPDFDGDGFSDLAVAATGEDTNGTAAPDAGAVHVIYGTASGLDSAGNQVLRQDTLFSDDALFTTDEADDAFGTTLAHGDFDGDGFDDLAIGIPFEDVGAQPDVGWVKVTYGSPNGIDTTRVVELYASTALNDTPVVSGSRLGAALVAADFDGDGFDDLAIGVPGMEVGGAAEAGEVVVAYGSPAGIDNTGWHHLDQNLLSSTAEPGDRFGEALAAGRFLGGETQGLAIGAPGETLTPSGLTDAGAIAVVYARPWSIPDSGLDPSTADRFDQSMRTVPGTVGQGDAFGAAMVSGDFDGDGLDELVVGAPGDDRGSGEVVVMGSQALGVGVTTAGAYAWSQDDIDPATSSEASDAFGAALATGDVDDDGFDELVIGSPGEDNGPQDAGWVSVTYGGSAGLSAGSTEVYAWGQGTFQGTANTDEALGSSLSMGDFDGDGFDDIVAGAPGDDNGTGGAFVVPGTATGIDRLGSVRWWQGSPGITGAVEAGDAFGGGIASGAR